MKGLYKIIVGFLILYSTLNANSNNKIKVLHTLENSRVLSMKILQEYALVGQHINYKNPKEKLNSDYSTLKNNILPIRKEIKSFKNFPKKNIYPLIKDASLKIANIEPMISKPSIDKALLFFKNIEGARVQINKATEITVKALAIKDIDFYTTRIATISQKLVALYLYKSWGLKIPDIDKHFNMMLNKFNKSTKALEKFADSTTPKKAKEIKTKLAEIKKDMKYFIFMKNSKHYIPVLLFNKSNLISNLCNEIAITYHK